MVLRLSKLIVVLALACSIGLHWMAFQSFAWASMLMENLRRDSLSQAVARTFDGQHPCQLCKAIAEGKKSEKKSDCWIPAFKTFEFTPATEDFALTPPARFTLAPCGDTFAQALFEAPPTPPPRAALA